MLMMLIRGIDLWKSQIQKKISVRHFVYMVVVSFDVDAGFDRYTTTIGEIETVK